MKRTKSFLLVTAAVLSLALVACGNDDNDDSDSPAGGSGQTTGVSTPAVGATSPGIVGGTSAAGTGTPATGAGVAAATATSAAVAAATAAPQVFDVKAGEWYFEQKDITARPGQITVRMNNVGPERPHTYTVKNLAGNADLARSDRAEPNQTVTVQFTLTEPGTYQVYCSLPGHADRGQVGTITVRS